MAKQLIKEAYRMQQLAGLIKEGESRSNSNISIADAFRKAGINLQAPVVTVDDEINVRKVKSGQMLLSALEKRAAGAAESPVFSFPADIADPAELMGKGEPEEPAVKGKSFKLMVDIVDGGFVEIYQEDLLNENYVDLAPINSPFMESEEVNETLDTREIDKKIQTDKDFLDKVKKATEEAEKGNTSALAALFSPMMKPFKEAEEEDDDMEDVESDEEELDYFSNKPGKKDEFDIEDDVEPTAKDVKATGADNSKQGRLAQLSKKKDAILAKFKSGQITIDQYKAEIGDIPVQIKKLQADIDRDLAIDDENEY